MQGLAGWLDGWMAEGVAGLLSCLPMCLPAGLFATLTCFLTSLLPYLPLPASRYRLLLAGAGGPRGVDALLNHVSFLHSQYQTLEDIPGGVEHMAEAQQVGGWMGGRVGGWGL